MTDTAPESLLDWMTGLVADPAARARFTADPQHELGEQGFDGLDPVDVAQAMPLVTDVVAARFATTVDLSGAPALLVGESPVDALVRHFSAVPVAVGPPPEHDLDDWAESLVDDLAGAPDGLEGVVANAPGVDLDLDGTGDLDGVHHDHDLDVMTRLDDDHALDGSAPAVEPASPTSALVPPGVGAPEESGAAYDPTPVPDPSGEPHHDEPSGSAGGAEHDIDEYRTADHDLGLHDGAALHDPDPQHDVDGPALDVAP